MPVSRPAYVSLQPADLAKAQFAPLAPEPNYDKEVLAPLHADQAAEAVVAAQAAKVAAQVAAQAAQEVQAALAAQTIKATQVAEISTIGTLTGSEGYSLPYGNCVDQAGVNNPGWGNPIDWPVLTQVASIGATVLFYFNHTAVVSGIWSNGDIEVYQQNAPGMAHRIPRSEIRGFR